MSDARWNCTDCPKTFARKGDLTRHKLTHSGIKPHICEACGKGFAQLSALKTHLNVHSKAKPYICGIGTCTKAFGDPSSRARHRKETHRREGAYKCIITDCGTRIKRRSAFVAHLRKHGLDPSSLDLSVIVVQSHDEGTPPPAYFASSDAEDKSRHKIESRSVTPSPLGDSTSYCILGNADEASRSTDSSGWSSDDLRDWSPENDALLLGTIFNQTVDGGSLSPPDDIYTYFLSGFENPVCLDNMLLTGTPFDYPLLVPPHSNLPVPEPFLETRSDASQSSSSSPSSTHSALDIESLLYNFC